MKEKKKTNKSTIVLILVFIAGLSLLLYPSLSNYWNSFHATRAIAGYTKEIENTDTAELEKMRNDAVEYNKTLHNKLGRYVLSAAEQEKYNSLLNVSGSGIMGEIEIPSIRVDLPVYHSVEETVLQSGAGHIPGTSLPVGGEGTHCVISGHRGLPSAKLFTNLDRLQEGDIFMLNVLGEVLTYEVDQIRIVLPDEMYDLDIIEKKDLCTLVTCTPYGINTHRLLVRGHRIETPEDINVVSEAVRIEPLVIAPMIGIPILVALLVLLMYRTRRPQADSEEAKEIVEALIQQEKERKK